MDKLCMFCDELYDFCREEDDCAHDTMHWTSPEYKLYLARKAIKQGK